MEANISGLAGISNDENVLDTDHASSYYNKHYKYGY